MQTFLPFPSFTASLDLLDKRRLNKQNVESTQILNVLLGRTNTNGKGWQNHPAVKMWRGYENALKWYKNKGMELGESRGITYVKLQREIVDKNANMDYPSFIGNAEFHMSHLANLKRKALSDFEKNRPELKANMISTLGVERFNEIDETLPYIWT